MTVIGIFRNIAWLEGLSYVVLFFIAMPLKYFFASPFLIRPVGMIHGLLFIAYMVLLGIAYLKYRWSISKAFILFVISLIPLGTFIWKDLYKE